MVKVYGLPEVPVVYSVCRDLEVGALRADILYEVKGIASYVRRSSDISTLAADPIISKYRPFTERHRRGSLIRVYPEVLVKGLLSTGRLPRCNTIVDIANAVSMLTRVPISSVDIDRASPPFQLAYLPRDIIIRDFRGRRMYVAKETIVLVDGAGRIVYVFPYKTTDVAPVTTTTRNAVFIGYGAPGVPLHLITSSIKAVVSYVESFVRGASCCLPELDVGLGVQT